MNHRTMGANQIPGRPQALSSYCAELGGIAGTLMLVKSSCQVHGISHGKMCIGLDNASVTAQSKDDSPLAGKAPSRDLVMDICQSFMNLPIKCKFFWIMGHADQKIGRETHKQSLNCLCDEWVKAHCTHFESVTGPWCTNE